jgi:hypothetical protein
MELLGDVGKWNLISVHSRTVLVSEQDRCTVCAKHTIGSEIVLYALNGSLGDAAQVLMVLRGDAAQVEARLEIVLILTQDTTRFAPNVP